MGNIKLTIVIMLKSLLAFCLYGYSLHAVANEVVATEAANSSARHEVELIRDKDYKCIQCHKDSQQTIHQTHTVEKLEEVGNPLNCTTCHGNIGPDHREGAPVVTKYAPMQSQQGTQKVHVSQAEILDANGQCMNCHTSENLQQVNWTHDVHAQNLTCSNCHDVHAVKQAKVLSFDRKEKIKMCVDCHSDFNQLKMKEEQ
ncbi:cytochrome c nitrite reductase pentaheme subunit [Vibrio maerlii]|uniref:cytochrome c nitrite reductase pentaheme subunit n=1 Tax=Vibrio maerlii TaxID=2231648 RepID=UPI000E3E57B5|nr:cytochrome c nitrite reductase pentaheme subunit [Vibrio maerlii]